MEETFEANKQEDHVKEWMVEFIAMVNGEKHHHLSVLYGIDQEDKYIRIAPTACSIEELDAAMDVFSCCVGLAYEQVRKV